MILKTLLSLGLIAHTTLGYEENQKEIRISSLTHLSKILYRTSRNNPNMDSNSENLMSGRKITKGMLSNINKYGCWCHFEETFDMSRGEPVDGFDSHCKQYHHSLQCLDSDNICGTGTDPHTVEYNLVLSQTTQGTVYDCNTANNNACEVAVCQSQLALGLGFDQEFESGNYLDLANFSAQVGVGTFDFASQCNLSGPGFDKESFGCCGNYDSGTRRPVMVEVGTSVDMECCVKPNGSFIVFNTAFMDCCSTSPYVRTAGTCD